jgi:hypothetical protein
MFEQEKGGGAGGGSTGFPEHHLATSSFEHPAAFKSCWCTPEHCAHSNAFVRVDWQAATNAASHG